MPSYQWEGLTPHGKVVRGCWHAPNESALRARLAHRRTTLLGKPRIRENARSIRSATRLPSRAEVNLFTRQLAVMIRAGLPIARALTAIEQQSDKPRLARIPASLRSHIEKGESLASALESQPQVFGRLYVAMIAAGEATGALEESLSRISNHLERADQLRRKLFTALLYPSLVVVVATGVTLCLLIFVVPIFADLFHSFGQDLPLPTAIVVGASHWLARYGLYLMCLLLLVAIAFHRAWRVPRFRRRIDSAIIRLPVIGPAIGSAEVAKITRVLGTVVAAGVPLLEALRIAGNATGNRLYQSALAVSAIAVDEGEPLASSLSKTHLLPETLCQLVAVGEATGTLDDALLKSAELYETEVDQRLERVTSLIEPAFIAILGIVVGGILLSLYLPIFQIGSLVR